MDGVVGGNASPVHASTFRYQNKLQSTASVIELQVAGELASVSTATDENILIGVLHRYLLGCLYPTINTKMHDRAIKAKYKV